MNMFVSVAALLVFLLGMVAGSWLSALTARER